MGTPEVAATVLNTLHAAATSPDSSFQLCAVVSQPGKPKGRGNKTTPVLTPVEEAARKLGMTDETILCPATAKDEVFLARMSELKPDLCVTAAYGNMLPQRFLDLPKLGTLNIHPSMLPKYRGAAPVQRAVQDGLSKTGVSVAYTVLKCDAGPVLAQEEVHVDPEIQAPELLSHLFEVGAKLLLSKLDVVFQGKGGEVAWPQDEYQAAHAPKLTKEESRLDLRACSAQELHDKVRAFAGWPGTNVTFVLAEEGGEEASMEEIEIKIIRTTGPGSHANDNRDLAPPSDAQSGITHGMREVRWSPNGSAMILPCLGEAGQGEGELRVTHVQPPTKKAITAAEFKNGLRKKKLLVRF